MRGSGTGSDHWVGTLLLGPGWVLYLGPGGSAAPHVHHAIQIVRAFDEPFELRLDGEPLRARAAIIPGGVRHGLESEGARLALVLVEPHGPRGAGLQERARELCGQDIEPLVDVAREPVGSVGSAEAFADRLLALVRPLPAGRPISVHVRAALHYLDTAIDGTPRLADAAGAAHISPPRLTHLFTSEVGIPFRRFVLWMRLRRVVEHVSAGADLTAAAAAAGFSDSAHLSRVFRATFGLSPSALLGMEVESAAWPS